MLPLHSSRLILRRFTEADVPSFLAYRNDPAVARYQSWESCSLAEATEFIRKHQAKEIGVPGEWWQIAIALRTTGLHIGDCALQIHADDARQATIGFTLARSHQGHGYATEALSALLDGAFLHLDLHRVVADTDPQNTRACALLERLGLRREAHLRQSLWFKGRWADEYLYAVLRKEWLRRSGITPSTLIQE